ncbi:MAG: hypothetical protein AAF623_13910 [Planctomycetota bacterium]
MWLIRRCASVHLFSIAFGDGLACAEWLFELDFKNENRGWIVSDTFLKIPGMQQKLKWAKIWFEQFVRFHQQQNNAKSWEFSPDDVIDVSKFDTSNGLLGFEAKTVANAKTANGANRIEKNKRPNGWFDVLRKCSQSLFPARQAGRTCRQRAHLKEE